MAEGARLESVFRGNSNVGSNPTLSASYFVIIDEVIELQRQQMNTHQEANLHGWIPKQSTLASDKRFARIAWLMRELTKLDESETER